MSEDVFVFYVYVLYREILLCMSRCIMYKGVCMRVNVCEGYYPAGLRLWTSKHPDDGEEGEQQ